jgi:hypothetical protein
MSLRPLILCGFFTTAVFLSALSTAVAQTPATLEVNVVVTHATDNKADVVGLPVIVQAVRPRGPFETTAPRPVFESVAITDESGRARIDDIPASVIEQGLRLQASATFGGLNFMSSPVTASRRASLTVRVHDKGHDPAAIHVQNLRVIVEPWEKYLVFTQYWTLAIDGDLAVDTSLLPGREFERGLPLRLPVKAEGIQAMGPGSNQAVNNVIFWNGVLKPGEPVTLQIRFSIPAKNPTFVYEQAMGYPTRNVELIAPLQTQFKKIQRLDHLELLAPGFTVGSDASALGLRDDMEFLIGTGVSLNTGEEFRFQLRGLPFRPPRGGWIALGLGLLGSIFVLGYGRRERALFAGRTVAGEALEALQRERDGLFDELTAVELEWEKEAIDEVSYETRAWLLRERLALVLKKIDDLQAQAA